jgi:hypothetical protein
MKYIHVTMPDGSKWRVKAEIVAASRATYYASDGRTPREAARWGLENIYAMTHDDELLDWAANNMNWTDVSRVAERVPEPTPGMSPEQFQEGWVNGGKVVVDE